MRRAARLIPLAILFGALATVVVAWGAVAFSGNWNGCYFMSRDADETDHAWLKQHAPADYWVASNRSERWHQDRKPGLIVESPMGYPPPSDDPPGTIVFRQYARQSIERVLAGWPWPALEYTILADDRSETTTGCWVVPGKMHATAIVSGPDGFVFPWRPAPLSPPPRNEELGIISRFPGISVGSGVGGWTATLNDVAHYVGRGLPGPPEWIGVGRIPGLGFVADVVFFALMFCGLHESVGRLRRRRRRRRGLCGGCGYDLRLRSGAVCPECGGVAP